MSEATTESTAQPQAPEEPRYGLGDEAVDAVLEALAVADVARVRELVLPYHYADTADLVERLPPEQRKALVHALGTDFRPEILSELDETVRDEIIGYLAPGKLAAALTELDSDDALDVVEELNKDEQREVLDAIPIGERALIEEGLAYPEDSAGRLMQREVVTVPTYWTVGETVDFMRQTADEGEDSLPQVFYDIFVVDPVHRPVGAVPLSRLLQAKRPVHVTDIMTTDLDAIPVNMDQDRCGLPVPSARLGIVAGGRRGRTAGGCDHH